MMCVSFYQLHVHIKPVRLICTKKYNSSLQEIVDVSACLKNLRVRNLTDVTMSGNC